MDIVYSMEEFDAKRNSIFLAGPTPRTNDVATWRIEALKILEEKGFSGTVFIPEYRSQEFGEPDDVNAQSLWERKALEGAGVIMFWIPRDLKELPGFITNVEFGKWVPSRKAIYGRPDEAPKNQYLDWFYNYETGNVPSNTLEGTIEEVLKYLETQEKGWEKYGNHPIFV